MSTSEARNHWCENFDGTVRWAEVEREVFNYKKQLITLEGIVIGVCDSCGLKYYSAETLHAVHAAAIKSTNG